MPSALTSVSPIVLLSLVTRSSLIMIALKEGIFGVTYQVVGRPGRPVLNVNILFVLMPGVLRKIFFEYPAAGEGYVDNPQ